MNAFDRDGISGWGAVVHIIEKDKEYIFAFSLKKRIQNLKLLFVEGISILMSIFSKTI